MIQNIIELIEKVDKKILNIINIGLHIGFIISLMGTILLAIHYKLYISPNLYYIGIGIFKIGLWTAVSFIVCGIGLWCVKERM
ncbi:MAG: hypothetical protein IKF52_06425 [Clostridia bacterium]|nr:hypothetical protein [Clostridia bacterium]